MNPFYKVFVKVFDIISFPLALATTATGHPMLIALLLTGGHFRNRYSAKLSSEYSEYLEEKFAVIHQILEKLQEVSVSSSTKAMEEETKKNYLSYDWVQYLLVVTFFVFLRVFWSFLQKGENEKTNKKN
jgi:hypothetical protein